MHHASDTFEELFDWSEPLVLELPLDISDRVRGESSEEKNAQEQREATALRAMYLSLEEVPESPAEPLPIMALDQSDSPIRMMMPGSEVEGYLFEQQQLQLQQPQQQNGASPSVADLIGQLNAGTSASNPIAGVDLKALVTDPSVATQVPPAQLQQLMQILGAAGVVGQQNVYSADSIGAAATWQAPPTHADTPAWADPGVGYGQVQSQTAPAPAFVDGQSDGSRWDGPNGGHGPRGGWRGGPRGRGRGRGGRSRVPCAFFSQGRCKYGDQCDFSHEISYG